MEFGVKDARKFLTVEASETRRSQIGCLSWKSLESEDIYLKGCQSRADETTRIDFVAGEKWCGEQNSSAKLYWLASFCYTSSILHTPPTCSLAQEADLYINMLQCPLVSTWVWSGGTLA